MNLGKAIKAIRTELNLTQGEFCEKIELSQTSLSQIELGYKSPSKKTVEKICKVGEIPVALLYILAIEEEDVPEAKSETYNKIYPFIKSLALDMVKS